MDELLEKKLEELRELHLNQLEQEKELKYRDRALEMRKLQGSGKKKITFSLKPNLSRFKTKPLVSTSKPISSDNIGKKMLEKMGWKSGQGLGVNKDGIKEPINVNFEFQIMIEH